MADGVSVAVFSFDSIDIGPNVNVTVTGQRALVLTSRSSVKIDTNFRSFPGALGGFPGGYSVGRRQEDRCVAASERSRKRRVRRRKCARPAMQQQEHFLASLAPALLLRSQQQQTLQQKTFSLSFACTHPSSPMLTLLCARPARCPQVLLRVPLVA
jgi:hypothetical protein